MNARTLLVHTVIAGTAACTAERAPEIGELSDADREAFLLAAIRDSGFICDAIMQVQRIADDGSAWRVSCTDITAYVATVEPDGSVTVSLAPYVEPTLRQQIPTVPRPPN